MSLRVCFFPRAFSAWSLVLGDCGSESSVTQILIPRQLPPFISLVMARRLLKGLRLRSQGARPPVSPLAACRPHCSKFHRLAYAVHCHNLFLPSAFPNFLGSEGHCASQAWRRIHLSSSPCRSFAPDESPNLGHPDDSGYLEICRTAKHRLAGGSDYPVMLDAGDLLRLTGCGYSDCPATLDACDPL